MLSLLSNSEIQRGWYPGQTKKQHVLKYIPWMRSCERFKTNIAHTSAGRGPPNVKLSLRLVTSLSANTNQALISRISSFCGKTWREIGLHAQWSLRLLQSGQLSQMVQTGGTDSRQTQTTCNTWVIDYKCTGIKVGSKSSKMYIAAFVKL